MIDLKKITKSIVLSVLTLLLSVTVLYAASTIGANIVTTGTLSVTDTSTLTGAVTTAGNATFGDAATDVNLFTGTLQASTTALFTNGLTTYSGGNVVINGFATTTASDGSISTSGELGVGTTTPSTEVAIRGGAATTTLYVHSGGADGNGPTGGCIQLEGHVDGAAASTFFKIYATTTGPLIATVGTCKKNPGVI